MTNKLNCILLVDDNDADNFIHQMTINKMGIAENIVVAENGLEALDFLKKANGNHPEIIFLDINMPAMNGWEFLLKYKELDPSQKEKTSIFMLTTSINPKDEKVAMETTDVKGFINKPLTKQSLAEIVEKHFKDKVK